jgi:hypothetical protein
MTPSPKLIPVVCLSVAFALSVSAAPAVKKEPSPAGNVSASPIAAKGAVKTERAVPFHGMIASVDEKTKTFTMAGKEQSRTFKMTDKTVATKAGKPATIKDVTVDEEVRGAYWKASDGTLEAKIVKLGPLTEAEKAADAARKAKRAEKKAAAASASASPATSASATMSPKP